MLKEKTLFSRKIEEYFSIEQPAVEKFVSEQLTTVKYDSNEVLGEKYFTIK